MSQRRQIRDKVVELLNAIPELANRVYANRVRKLFSEELPAVLVYARNESAKIDIEAPRQYKRTLALTVHVFQKFEEDEPANPADPKLDDKLDIFAELIEQKLFQNEDLAGLASDLRLSDTEIDFNADGDLPHGEARITFEIDYYTNAPIEQPGLSAFVKAHIEHEVQPPNNQAPAIDDITLPQV